MQRRATFLFLLTIFAGFTTTDVRACSCWMSDRERIQRVDLVASGWITSVEMRNGSNTATFVPIETWKGTPGYVVDLGFYTGVCGVSFRQGEEILLLAVARDDGTYFTDGCTWGGRRSTPLHPSYETVLLDYRDRWRERVRIVESRPDDIDAKLELARFLESEHDRAGARAQFEAVISLRPRMSRGHVGLGRILLSFRSYKAALIPLKRAVELDPTDNDTRRLLHHTQIRLGVRLDYTQVDFRGLVLRDLDLSGQDLKGADFSGAALSGAEFRDAQLDGAILDHTDLSGANFTGASLRHAQLTDSNLSSANFSDAEMTGARLSGSQLERANLSGASLRGVDFRGAGFWPTAYWYEGMVHARFDAEVFGDGGLSARPSWQRRPQDSVSWSTRLTYSGMIELELDETLFRQRGLSGQSLATLMLSGVNLTGATYDCTTAWPEGMSVTGLGLILSGGLCNGSNEGRRTPDAE